MSVIGTEIINDRVFIRIVRGDDLHTFGGFPILETYEKLKCFVGDGTTVTLQGKHSTLQIIRVHDVHTYMGFMLYKCPSYSDGEFALNANFKRDIFQGIINDLEKKIKPVPRSASV